MAEHFVSAGNEILNELCSGIESDVITTIYGPPGSGKTNFCILASVDMVNTGKTVIYIDTDGSFSVERLKQIAGSAKYDYKKILEKMVFYMPVNFQEQKDVFEKLRSGVNEKVGMIIVDSIAMLYRLEIGKNAEEVYDTNRELGRQLSFLSEIARKKNIPILVTNQVYSSMDEKDKNRVSMVGGDILRYSSKCLIEVQNFKNLKKVILIRHRSLPQNREIVFRIIESGAEIVDEE
jgi:DNA repair protein RadB